MGGANETSKIGPEGGQVGKSDLPPLVQGGQTNISYVRLGGAPEPPSNYANNLTNINILHHFVVVDELAVNTNN